MPLILRNCSFLFILQSQPFYQAQSVTLLTPYQLGLQIDTLFFSAWYGGRRLEMHQQM